MKIDLHCHTKRTKKGDGKFRAVSTTLFKEKIELAEIKIAAITNHNAFDKSQYYELRNSVAETCQVWPGVEIDVWGETKFHLIVIVKPDDTESFALSVEKLFMGEKPDDAHHTLEEVCECFENYEALFIPHFHDKKPAISLGDKDKLSQLVGDEARVFIEPRNHRTLGVLANKDLSVLIGSDVQDWRKYEESTFAELRLPVKSFSEFLLLSRRDKTVVETLLGGKKSLEIIGNPHPTVSLPLRIYPEVNIIFGSKGTGKTEILKSICDEMQVRGLNCKSYIASERSEKFSLITDISDMEIDLEKLKVDSCDDAFAELAEWRDTNPIQFADYINWYRTRGYSNNKQRMKITESVHLSEERDSDYGIHKQDNSNIKKALGAISKVDIGRYLSEEDSACLEALFHRLAQEIQKHRKDDLVHEYAVKLANKSIDQIKSIADRSSDTVSRPSTAGLTELADSRRRLKIIVDKILENLSVPEYNEKCKIGSLDGKGDIFVNCKYRMVCEEERTANFPGYRIRELREIKEKLEDIQAHIYEYDIAARVSELVEKCEENKITNIKPFIGKSKQIVTADGLEYTPSNGEKGILLLENTLQDEADAYFLDEPELGMGNSYIDTDIRPMISRLAQKRKFVVVATHNANIAVRTLPYMSIFRCYENGQYKTYMGNPFDDQLVNIYDSTDVLSWTEESMHSLEGGKEAFYERRDIYESKDN